MCVSMPCGRIAFLSKTTVPFGAFCKIQSRHMFDRKIGRNKSDAKSGMIKA